jgi:hypothetical protein
LKEIDRVASVIPVARPAPPSFVPSMVTMHRDGRVVVLVVTQRAMPSPSISVRHRVLVEQCAQVGSVEDVGD